MSRINFNKLWLALYFRIKIISPSQFLQLTEISFVIVNNYVGDWYKWIWLEIDAETELDQRKAYVLSD